MLARARVALLLLFSASACSQPTLSLPVDNVVLVSIDSLRADHLGIYGYAPPTSPTLDALGATGVVFDRAYSTTTWTLPSHAALFTGLDDLAHGVVDTGTRLPEAVDTLAESLARAGVHTTGFFSGPYLHPAFGLSQGFDEYVDCTSLRADLAERRLTPRDHLTSHRDITNPVLLDAIGSWLAKPRAARNFLFIHMWDVHYDYIPPERYVRLFDPGYGGSVDGRNYVYNTRIHAGMRPRDLQHVIALYDGEIRYTDDTLGSILEMLGKAGLLESAAVIVIADHGEEFFEHGKKGHRNNLFEESLRVPLILQVPGFTPRRSRVDEVVSLVDLYPTVCELLGAPCEPGRPGVSLLGFLQLDEPRLRGDALAELTRDSRKTRLLSLVRRQDKVIMRLGRPTIHYIDDPSRERDGLRATARELAEQSPPAKDILERLRTRAESAEAMGAGWASGEEPVIDAKLRAQLESLGYGE